MAGDRAGPHPPRIVGVCADMSEDEWAECCAAVSYVLTAAVASGAIDDHEAALRRLYLTAALLQRVPPRGDMEILDPNRAIDLFFSSVTVAEDHARRASAEWRSLDIHDIRRLRRAKNLVKPALLIADATGRSDIERRLAAWRETLPLLP